MRRSSLRTAVVLLVPALLGVASWGVLGRTPGPVAREEPAKAKPEADKVEKLKVRVLENVPDQIQARIEQRKRMLLRVVTPAMGLAPHAVLNLTKRWANGQTIKIAFLGGDSTLRKRIADAVAEWTQFANLTFDFGLDSSTGKYREWKSTDAGFTADIRISFDKPGYYSLVGRDSVDPVIARPGEESLNLQGFDKSLPPDWKGVALHEFGHAIGFEHEHQGPDSMCDFRFEDEPGYVPTTDDFGQFTPDRNGRRPGLYTLLGGPPNNWPQAVVDHNLKDLPASNAFSSGPFDKHSIMKYFFPDYMFVSGTSSPCYTDAENVVLSALDKEGAARVYPRAPEEMAADDKVRARVYDALSKVEGLPSKVKQHLDRIRAALED